MTPVAHRLLKWLLTNDAIPCVLSDRMRDLMRDIHCFECSDVVDLAKSIGDEFIRRDCIDDLCTFLPAEKTWIEFWEDGSRTALLLQRETSGFATVYALAACPDDRLSNFADVGRIKLDCAEKPSNCMDGDIVDGKRFTAIIYGLLAIINTPRVIGRRQHAPHRGLEKRLLDMKRVVGRFPLNAWTEITLSVAVPRDESNKDSREAHLTGQKAYHFCRAHCRIRLGKLEFVRDHWRGDKSLGTKRSRYTLRKPRFSGGSAGAQ